MIEPLALTLIAPPTSYGQVIELVSPPVRTRHDVLERGVRGLPAIERHTHTRLTVNALADEVLAIAIPNALEGGIALGSSKQQTARSTGHRQPIVRRHAGSASSRFRRAIVRLKPARLCALR
jgi:hypothetical protein